LKKKKNFYSLHFGPSLKFLHYKTYGECILLANRRFFFSLLLYSILGAYGPMGHGWAIHDGSTR